MLSFLWLVGLCWFHPPHVTDSRPSCSRNKVFVASSDELLLVFVDFIPLLYYFPLSSPLLGTRFLQQPMQKAAECYFFWLSKAVFLLSQAEGDVRPPPATSRLDRPRRAAAASAVGHQLQVGRRRLYINQLIKKEEE